MSDEIVQDAGTRMAKSIEALQQSLGKVRTGRAHPNLLHHLTVDYYGTKVPISQVANIGVEDARTLTVTPWEKHLMTSGSTTMLLTICAPPTNSSAGFTTIP